MSLPSDNISPSELFLALTKVPRPHRIVDFPRKGPDGKPLGEIAITILSQEQQMEAAANAERYARKILKEVPKSEEARRGYDDIYTNAAACEILFKACRDKDDPKKQLFPTVEDIRRWLTMDEVGVLMSHYMTAQAELGPIVASMSDADVDAWIARIKDAGTLFPLDLLSSEALKTLVSILVSRLVSLQTASSYAGSQLDEPEKSEASPTET